MSTRLNLQCLLWCAFLGTLFVAASSKTIVAQSVVNNRNDVVEVPAHQLAEIQEELKYLRARDAEHQAWEASMTDQLPVSKTEAISYRNLTNELFPSASTGYAPAACSDTPGACCSSCGSTSCQCPLPQAPCIDCPHVSTLSPYFNVSIFGALKLDTLFNRPRPIAPGTPFFLAPDSLTGLSQNTVDIHARQTTLGAAFTGPKIGDFQSGGLFIALLYNDAVIVDRYGFLPLQAYGELRNQDWRFAAGLQFDVFAPGLPTVLPFSALGASGNAGNSFRGQARIERFLYPSDDSQLTLQGALSEPITTTIDPAFGLIEDNGWPNVEGRIAWAAGPLAGAGAAAKRPLEIGVSGVVGQIRNTRFNANTVAIDRVVSNVWGLSSDFRWQINDAFGVMGEVYTGQALGNYNGGILQATNPETFAPIRTTGGWLEVFTYLTPAFHNHTGYGIDDPLDRDLVTMAPGLARTLNSTIYSNFIWDVNSTFRVACEFAWRETNYLTAGVPDNQGPGFHTQFQWAF